MNIEIKRFIYYSLILSLITIAGYIIAPIEVQFLKTLTQNTLLIGLVYAVGSIFFGILSVILGRLSDKYGREHFIIIGIFLSILYPLLYSFSYNIFQYMGVKIIWAFASVATGPIFMAHLQDILQGLKKQGYYIGLVFSFQALFGAIASFIGGHITDKYSFAAPYILMSIIFTLAFALSLFGFKYKRKKYKKKFKKGIKKKKDLFHGIKYIFQKKELKFYFISNIAFGLNWGIKGMLWPLIIYSLSGNNTTTGNIFATMGIIAFIFLLFIGKLIDKIGPFKTTLFSLIILSISGTIISQTDKIYILWISAGIFAIGEALFGPSQSVILTKHVENQIRGEILGLDAVFDKIINTIAPFIAGILLKMITPQQILFIYISFLYISLINNIIYLKHNNNSNNKNKNLNIEIKN